MQLSIEIKIIFLYMHKSFAEKSPRPGHNKVTTIYQNSVKLFLFKKYKITS